MQDILTPEVKTALVQLVGAIIAVIVGALGIAATKLVNAMWARVREEAAQLKDNTMRVTVGYLVDAAEQIWKKPETQEKLKNIGAEKLAYVREEAAKKGFEVADSDIEAAVALRKQVWDDGWEPLAGISVLGASVTPQAGLDAEGPAGA